MNNIKRARIFKNGTTIRPKQGFRPFNEGYTPTPRRYSQSTNGMPANTLVRPRAPKGGSGEIRRLRD